MPRSRVSLDVSRPTTRSRAVKPKSVGALLVKKKSAQSKVSQAPTAQSHEPQTRPQRKAKVAEPTHKKTVATRRGATDSTASQKRSGVLGSVRKEHVKTSDSKGSPTVTRRAFRNKIGMTDSTPPAPPASSVAPVLKKNLQLALLSPFRFPLDSARVAAQAARLSGVTFVIVGAILTLLNLDIAVGGQFYQMIARQSASTIETLDNSTTTSSGSGNTTSTLDPTPQVTMSLSSNTVLSGVVPVYITVPYATTVNIVAFDTTEGQARWSGAATPLDDRNWKAFWDTTKLNDGTYMLRARIKNEFGQYEYSHPHQYTIDNFQSTTVSDGSNQTTTTTTSGSGTGSSTTLGTTSTSGNDTNTTEEQSTTDVEPVVAVPVTTLAALSVLNVQPVTTWARFVIVSADTDRVKLTARSKRDSKVFDIGSAIYKGNNEWRFDWNVEIVMPDTYLVRAHIRRNSGALETSNAIDVTVARPLTTTTATTTTNLAPDSESADTSPPTPTLKPFITISFPYDDAVSSFTDITVKVAKARFIELYVRPENALTPRFIGLARHVSGDEWHLRWDTTKTPNGDYEMFARVSHEYGTTESGEIPLTVRNAYTSTLTEAQKKQITELKETYQATQPPTVVTATREPIPSATAVAPLSDKIAELRLEEEDLQERLYEFFEEYRVALNEITTAYAEAIRRSDAAAKQAAEEVIATLRAEMIDSLNLPTERAYALADLDAYIHELTTAALQRAERNEAIIKERLAERVLLDTDRDGISDFDEINLYGTDPFRADTDGDGVTDGLEILGGFDPLSAQGETLVVYESPKDSGIIRDDVLRITMIDTLSSTVLETERTAAVISGTGLPNAFVTLYIFSTPIVVTVRTDENGNWTYIFDKELEDGEHEIFAAMTDNRGAIVAKSNPFAFTKTAQAFTPVDAGAVPAIAITPVEPSFWTSQLLIVIASLSVVALGLVLLLLGLHVEARRPKPPPV